VLAAVLMNGCGSDSGGNPDLVPTSLRELYCASSGCGPLLLEVCVDNIGDGDASQFDVTLNDSHRADVAALAAGESACVQIESGVAGPGYQAVVDIDSLDEVAESDESNNRLTFPVSDPTRCDLICRDPAHPAPTPPPPSAT